MSNEVIELSMLASVNTGKLLVNCTCLHYIIKYSVCVEKQILETVYICDLSSSS